MAANEKEQDISSFEDSSSASMETNEKKKEYCLDDSSSAKMEDDENKKASRYDDSSSDEDIDKINYSCASLRNARLNALLAEEKWLIEHLRVIRQQRNALRLQMPDDNLFMACPYNTDHQILRSNLESTKLKCKKLFPKLLVCPYNDNHHLPKSEMRAHIAALHWTAKVQKIASSQEKNEEVISSVVVSGSEEPTSIIEAGKT